MVWAKKSLGQHFLKDAQVIDQIVSLIDPKPGEQLLEIGPGQGALTIPVLQKIGHLTAIEIDPYLARQLENRAVTVGELVIKRADVLTVNFTHFGDQPLRLFGNLPYQISTTLLFYLLAFRSQISDLTFMLQREVVERICACPGSKRYGRLSVMLQLYFSTHDCFVVPPVAFSPPPKVDSALVQLRPHASSPPLYDHDAFFHVVKMAFSQRRKLLANNLKGILARGELAALGISPKARAEQLDLETFIALGNRYYELTHTLPPR